MSGWSYNPVINVGAVPPAIKWRGARYFEYPAQHSTTGRTMTSLNPSESNIAKIPAETLPAPAPVPSKEVGGRDGPEPTRYGDWEKNGRCIDF
jgi:hypothetical protein